MRINSLSFKKAFEATTYQQELNTAHKRALRPNNVEVAPDKISYSFRLDTGEQIKYVTHFNDRFEPKSKERYKNNNIEQRTIFYPNGQPAYNKEATKGNVGKIEVFNMSGKLIKLFHYSEDCILSGNLK